MGDCGIVGQPWETTLIERRRRLDGVAAAAVGDGGGDDWRTACRIVTAEDYNPRLCCDLCLCFLLYFGLKRMEVVVVVVEEEEGYDA